MPVRLFLNGALHLLQHRRTSQDGFPVFTRKNSPRTGKLSQLCKFRLFSRFYSELNHPVFPLLLVTQSPGFPVFTHNSRGFPVFTRNSITPGVKKVKKFRVQKVKWQWLGCSSNGFHEESSLGYLFIRKFAA